jgi:CBS domain-containing protein
MRVRDPLTAERMPVPVSASLAATAEAMLRADVGSVLVTDDGTPAGIVTAADVLRVVVESGRPLDESPAHGAMSASVASDSPDTPAELLAEEFERLEVEPLLLRGRL